MLLLPTRRGFLLGASALGTLPLLGCAAAPPAAPPPTPIVFVHGNGDTAALWHTILWRFESNGFPRDRLAAIDFRYPLARNADDKEQALRSSSTEARQELAAFVADVKRRTGAEKVALVASSRGGNAVRNFLKNGGGAAHVSHAVLCGTPNHGVIVSDKVLVGSEFNGAGSFLRQLNDGPDEVVPGIAWATTRSDNNDKFAQPDGKYLGLPAGTPTGVGFDGPALKGAKDIVLPGLDHREVAFHPKAFAALYEFLLGKPAASLNITPEAAPVLNGKVNGMPGGVATNLPLQGALVEIYETDPASGQRRGLVHSKTTGADGLWGPFTAKPDASYEFVVAAPGEAITHIYRTPFPRSSDIVHLRPGRLSDADKAAGSSITLTRPRGYFGHGRDVFTIDGAVAPGVPEGVPANSTGTLRLPPGPARAVAVRGNDEQFVVQSWPTAENRVVFAEMHY
ncbi:alpha/beta fold hydrolase [Ferrovibrio sp.]|uniref:alpha/beta fold hydrolase n=1 Tax=Ferrovibrio sp. TaxID=1917215 RepID=UPI001B59B40E|nr:alpha/beta fold hydrolase [Ferrovibrio sp.]MBP7063503.1 hydrolase [Ferrovibrio sp.]